MTIETDQSVLDALGAAGITTGLLARMDFQTSPAFVSTLPYPIQVEGSGDSELDGQTFEPLVNGAVVNVGDNQSSFTGSEAMTISLALPADVSEEISIAANYPEEWRSRQVTIWRAIMLPPTDPLAAPAWMFRRVRTGAMDKLEIQADGTSRTFNLTIEGHASLISVATGSTYLDQKRFDPADTSQDYAVAIGNGDPAPTKPSNAYIVGQALQQLKGPDSLGALGQFV